MKRHELLVLTGCNVKRFEGYSFRRQLPFSVLSTDERGAKRASYALKEAFALRLMMEMVDDSGLDLDAAKYVAANAWTKIVCASEWSGDDDLWVVFAQERHAVEGIIGRTLFVTTLAHLADAIGEHVEPEAQRRIVMVNVSALSNELRSNADEWDIVEGQGAGPVWGELTADREA